MASIFERVRLKPSQLRTVAERRYADADALRKTGQNARANGVMYLGGFVLECLLKANLLETYTWLQNRSPTSASESVLWNLCYLKHDLASILAKLPALRRQLAEYDPNLLLTLEALCAIWTVHARYSPHQATMKDAADFLNQIKEIRRCLG